METSARIFVAGHGGLVGGALVRRLRTLGYQNLILKTRAELDLTDQASVRKFFSEERPEYVFLAAAKVGGIGANAAYPAQFIYQNLMIACNVIDASRESGVRKLLNLGSSCIYPKLAPQPMKEEYLLTGSLEPTNEAYAIAKIAAIRMCKHYNAEYGTDYISAMPTNLYGPGDTYDLENSHVLPAMIRKFHEAKVRGVGVTLWGDGSPLREFLYSDDLADACVFLMNSVGSKEIGDFINVGYGSDLTIKELSVKVAGVVGYEGPVAWDTTKPNGTPRKLMDCKKINNLGWKPQISIEDGLVMTYQHFLKSQNDISK